MVSGILVALLSYEVTLRNKRPVKAGTLMTARSPIGRSGVLTPDSFHMREKQILIYLDSLLNICVFCHTTKPNTNRERRSPKIEGFETPNALRPLEKGLSWDEPGHPVTHETLFQEPGSTHHYLPGKSCFFLRASDFPTINIVTFFFTPPPHTSEGNPVSPPLLLERPET